MTDESYTLVADVFPPLGFHVGRLAPISSQDDAEWLICIEWTLGPGRVVTYALAVDTAHQLASDLLAEIAKGAP
jgi:hypothetical protein